MTNHIAKRLQYNQDERKWLEAGAPEGKEPWREWDFDKGTGWLPLCREPRWFLTSNYRRPRTITIGKRVINAPMREKPKHGCSYYIPAVHDSCIFFSYAWADDFIDLRLFDCGLCFHTAEDAAACANAILELLRGDV